MRSRVHSRGFVRRQKPPMQWVASGAGYASLASAMANATLVTFELVGATPAATFDPPAIDRFTLLRIRGQMGVNYQPGAGGQSATLSFGIIKLTRNTGSAPTIPNPSSAADAGAPWLYLMTRRWASQANAVTNASCDSTWEVDIKTKRVFREGDVLLGIGICNFTAGGSCALDLNLRSLIARVA